eukprot:TRINITY_DN27515_c0_g1_i1.p2 TRINITY_DN27515_c0_g1~~TRINITY_DN27515_c0_g1_i1.p2  ORF type:complete len:169 (+),score=3.49 TRINITY_DN27515_c0_g1_i1:236-742(+)
MEPFSFLSRSQFYKPLRWWGRYVLCGTAPRCALTLRPLSLSETLASQQLCLLSTGMHNELVLTVNSIEGQRMRNTPLSRRPHSYIILGHITPRKNISCYTLRSIICNTDEDEFYIDRVVLVTVSVDGGGDAVWNSCHDCPTGGDNIHQHTKPPRITKHVSHIRPSCST